MLERPCRKFGDARRTKIRSSKGRTRKKEERGKRFGIEVADGIRLSTNHLVTLRAVFRKEARKPATLPDKLDARLKRRIA